MLPENISNAFVPSAFVYVTSAPASIRSQLILYLSRLIAFINGEFLPRVTRLGSAPFEIADSRIASSTSFSINTSRRYVPNEPIVSEVEKHFGFSMRPLMIMSLIDSVPIINIYEFD